MKNSQQQLGNEDKVTLHKNINLVPRLLSHFHMMLFFWWCHLYREDFWYLLIYNLQSVVCSLQSANVIHRIFSNLNSPHKNTVLRNHVCSIKTYLFHSEKNQQEILTHTVVLCILPQNNVMFGEIHTISARIRS